MTPAGQSTSDAAATTGLRFVFQYPMQRVRCAEVLAFWQLTHAFGAQPTPMGLRYLSGLRYSGL